MSTPSYPLSLPSGPNFSQSTFEIVRKTGYTESPFTGKQQVHEYPYALWRATLTLPPIKRADWNNWAVFVLQMRGRRGTFLLGDPDYTFSGTATSAVDLATNSGLEISSNKLQIAKGISQHDTAQFAAGVVDDDFLRIDGTTVEGRSASEVLSDISAAPAAGSSNIVTTGALDSGSISSNFGAINNGASNITTTGTVAAGIVDITSDAHLDSSPGNNTVSGVTATFTAGEALQAGECVYYKASDSKMHKAVAAAGSVTPPCIALAAENLAADASGKFLLVGFIRNDDDFPTYTAGDEVYTPEAETSSQNVPEATAPDSDGDLVQVLGIAIDGNTLYFNPSLDVIEHA